uniref:Uncharacterized protein n=1 Tax=Ralstonia solanacearum TaxID=305 RepID=A0A0S4U445_RALSL|nr:conserved protein of unknown function [Ralstonia solanacearum]
MRSIAFAGGSSVCELGPASDVVLFFDCVRNHVEKMLPARDWSLLTDRLYRRYLRLEELEAASALMDEVRAIFATLPAATSVEWNSNMVGNREKSWLDPSRETLADVFSKYFEHFAYCVESARINYEGFKNDPEYTYEPVRTVIADLPGLSRDQNKPLAEYDALEGKPFWLQ